MRRAKQAASDASNGKNEQLRLLCEEFKEACGQLKSTLEAVGTEREVIARFMEKVRSAGADGEKLYADELNQWHDRLRLRAGILNKTREDLLIATARIKVVFEVKADANVVQSPQQAAPADIPAPPWIGEFLICLFVRPDRQEDRLADFAEKYRTLWLPKFPRLAGALYVAHVLWSAVDVARITAIAAVVDWVRRFLGR